MSAIATSQVLCPKCGRPLAACGEVEAEFEVLAVYECRRCTRAWEIEGATFETNLSFALDEDGNALDPDSLEPLWL